tara:strand:- start:1578 stop:1958 length:381 start_codon:yes stop_codon:yes gene_type:complete
MKKEKLKKLLKKIIKEQTKRNQTSKRVGSTIGGPTIGGPGVGPTVGPGLIDTTGNPSIDKQQGTILGGSSTQRFTRYRPKSKFPSHWIVVGEPVFVENPTTPPVDLAIGDCSTVRKIKTKKPRKRG